MESILKYTTSLSDTFQFISQYAIDHLPSTLDIFNCSTSTYSLNENILNYNAILNDGDASMQGERENIYHDNY